MFIKYTALIFLLFSISLKAENPYLFKPNFNGQPVFVPQGANIVPLCSDPSNPICFSQWTHQAVPLANYLPGDSLPQYNYFLPSFIPVSLAENPEEDEDWEEFYLTGSSSRFSKRRRNFYKKSSENKTKAEKDQKPKRRFYKDKSNPEKIRIVEKDDETGELKVQEGTVAFVNMEDIKTVSEEKKPDLDLDKLDLEPDKPGLELDKKELDKKDSESSKKEQAERTEKQEKQYLSPPPASHMVFPKPAASSAPQIQTDSDQSPDESSLTEQAPAADLKKSGSDISEQENVVFTVSRDTYALSSAVKEVQPGCVIINRQEEKTEAGFCAECVRSEEDSTVLSSLIENQQFLDSLKGYLVKVKAFAKDKIAKQTFSNESEIQKICSPEISLKLIIKNFINTCSADFKDFFEKAHCQSCKKGIPVELMMAMMSIESAGRCPATANNSLEQSAGLFQIDNKQHSCTDEEGRTYQKNTKPNLQCLRNPVNNLNKSVDILANYYDRTNSKKISKGQCKNWINLKPEERDSWRRSVSAYNGGPAWIMRAIRSARNIKTISDTSYLPSSQSNGQEKHDKASWEDLRMFFFIEKLSPGNRGSGQLPECSSFLEKDNRGTGRRLCLTVSNVAHTEAVLGREIKGSVGIVEMWSQYKKNFLKHNSVSCN